MTKNIKTQSEPTPITLQSHQAGAVSESPSVKCKEIVHNSTYEDDSLPLQTDVADDYLHECIARAEAEISRNANKPSIPLPADAALVDFLSAHIAAHPAPQHFMRLLKSSISGLEESSGKAEQNDA